MSVIAIENLSKIYTGKKRQRVKALTDLTLSVARGETLGLLGPNGAGKSTTIKILTGQVKASRGNAKLCGIPVDNHKARRKVGYLPENPAFYDFMSATEYLQFVAKAHELKDFKLSHRIHAVLERLDLHGSAKRPIKGFSKGMVQRLGLAQALLADPDVFILDEPMSGLDPIGRSLVKEIITELSAVGKTVLFSTHITADVERICDRVAVLVKGNLMADGAVRDILDQGIMGYRLETVDAMGVNNTLEVAPEKLKREMTRLLAENMAIERIEPQRKDLEDFFLDTVRRGEKL